MTRDALLSKIRKSLDDGHPNPEGFMEWCAQQTIETLQGVVATIDESDDQNP